MSVKKTTVSIIQARAVYYDISASLEKAVSLIEEASKQGAKLISLGETWLAGYPAWLDYCPNMAIWDHEPTKAVFARLYENSVSVNGKEVLVLCQLAKRLGVVIVIGVNERVDSGRGNGTIFNTLLTINTEGEIINHHRKLMPTYTERLVWGHGDAKGLQAQETSIGRVGGLICWEHWMPLARQAMHNSAEDIHITVWPAVKEMHQIAARHYAFEGRCFVLSGGNIMTVSDIPDEFDLPDNLKNTPDTLILNGGSAIIAPDGRYIVEPVFDKETILTAEIDLSEIPKGHLTLDVTGHYARNELFEFEVNRTRRT